jgi:hypothetical protein
LTPADLIERAAEAFSRARGSGTATDIDAELAGRRIRFSFAGEAFRADLQRALALQPIPTKLTDEVDLTVNAWAAASTSAHIDSGSWLGLVLGPAGVVEDLSDERYQVSLDLHASLVTAYDSEERVAYHYARSASLLPAWEVTHPCRMLWSAWGRANGMQLCHAAAVADDRGGVLLVGPSGSGKSTTTLACLAAGMQSVGDDYVLVEGAAGSAHALIARAVYRSISVEQHHADAFMELMPLRDGHFAMSADRTKSVVFASGHDSRPLVAGSFPLVAVVVPRVAGDGQTGYTPVSGGAALRALAPSTMAQLGAFDANVLSAMSAICKRLPSYELRLGADLSKIPERIREIIGAAGAQPRRAVASSA